jgi:hypothetical protein
VGPPPPFACSDRPCCAIGNQACDPNTVQFCPGLPGPAGPTPPSATGINHFGPSPVQVCGNCVRHVDNGDDVQTTIKSLAGAALHPLPHKAQLCHDCIKDEMVLYWHRQGTQAPAGPLSIGLVEQWPAAANGIQDLCICEAKAVTPFQNHCHNCRRTARRRLVRGDKRQAEEILSTREKLVVTGRRLCNLNGGHHDRLRVPGNPNFHERLCPCGRKPKKPHKINRRPNEYITYCLACMGVRVVPRNLPYQYKQHRMDDYSRTNPRRSARINAQLGGPASAAPVVYGNTMSPLRAPRNHLFRVNIERGWVPNDPLVGGTY